MAGTNYDKICFITLKQAIDLRYPVVISTCDYPVGNAWDIVEHAASNSPNPIGVALFPCAVQLFIRSARRGDETNKVATSPHGRQIKSAIIEL